MATSRRLADLPDLIFGLVVDVDDEAVRIVQGKRFVLRALGAREGDGDDPRTTLRNVKRCGIVPPETRCRETFPESHY